MVTIRCLQNSQISDPSCCTLEEHIVFTGVLVTVNKRKYYFNPNPRTVYNKSIITISGFTINQNTEQVSFNLSEVPDLNWEDIKDIVSNCGGCCAEGLVQEVEALVIEAQGYRNQALAAAAEAIAAAESSKKWIYIAWADDALGNGFSLTTPKDFIQILVSNVEIINPVVGDFAGTWFNYKGAQGVQGPQGIQGIQGVQGVAGDNGWSPVFAVASDGNRRVLQVTSWVGGAGVPPTSGLYVGPLGFVADIADGVNIADDVISLTTPAVGDLLQWDGTNMVNVDPLLILPTYAQYGNGSPARIWAADNFELRGVSPTNDITGKTYGSSSAGLGGYLTLDTSGLPASADARNFRIFITDETRIGNQFTSLIFYKDVNNFIEVEFTTSSKVNVAQTLSGVRSIIYTSGGGSASGPERFIFDRKVFYDNRAFKLYAFDFNGTLTRVDQTVITANNQLNFIGIKNNGGTGSSILNYRIEMK